MDTHDTFTSTTGVVTNAIIYTLVRMATQQTEQSTDLDESKKVFTIVDSINRNLTSVE